MTKKPSTNAHRHPPRAKRAEAELRHRLDSLFEANFPASPRILDRSAVGDKAGYPPQREILTGAWGRCRFASRG